MTSALVPDPAPTPAGATRSTPTLPADAEALFGSPFTPAMAARHGTGRSVLERLVRDGHVVRLIRGVYLGAGVAHTPAVRAGALALVVGARQTVVGATAAWLHGCAAEVVSPCLSSPAVPVELARRSTEPNAVMIAGLRVQAPVQAAAEVLRRAAGPAALAGLDSMLRTGSLRSSDLLRIASLVPTRSAICAQADDRAATVAESVLRYHWWAARLPTPRVGFGAHGIRLALALPLQRFAVVVGNRRHPAYDDLAERGWGVVALPRARLLVAEPEHVREHLEREFHRHLLAGLGEQEPSLDGASGESRAASDA